MLRDFYLLRIYVLPKHGDNFLNSFLMMIMFVYVTVLPFSFPDEKLQFSQMG